MRSLSNYRWHFFTELEQKISQFIWKHKSPWIAKAVLRKKNETGGINLPDFRLYYKATIIKTVRCWHKTETQTNATRWKAQKWAHAPTGTLFLTKEARIYNGAKTASSISWCWENWTATCKTMILEHFLTPYTKINSKWMKDLNVRPETIKLLEENRQNTRWHKSKQDPLWLIS